MVCCQPVVMANVAVYCGSSGGVDPIYRTVAAEVGASIAADGHQLVYGGGSVGLMGAVADAALAGGGNVLGIITQHLLDKEVGHHGVTELAVEDDMHARKAAMATHADGVIVLPGGFGTLDETFEVLTWNQLGVHPGSAEGVIPVVFLDVDGYFEDLFAFIERIVESGFVRPEHGTMAQRILDPVEAVRLAAAGPTLVPPKWTDRDSG